MRPFSFKKEEKILNRSEYVYLNLHGKKKYSENFVIIFKKNKGIYSRLGITVSKKIGNSVKRNKVKRLVREFFRLNKQYIPKGYDIVIIARKKGSEMDFHRAQKELGGLLSINNDFF